MELNQSFNQIREELDTHLDSINGNTNEIQNLFDYLSEVELKVNKLTERLDEVTLAMNPELKTAKFDIELSLREQEVFMCLYTSERPLTLIDVARRIGLTEDMINNILYKLITKGIPIIKSYRNESMFLQLDSGFKDLQARKNLLNIDEKITKEMSQQKLI